MDNEKKILKLKKHIRNLQGALKALSHIEEKELEAWWIQAHLHLYNSERGGIEAESFALPGEMQFISIRRNLGPKRELALRFSVIKKQKKDLIRIQIRIKTAEDAILALEQTQLSEKAAAPANKEFQGPRKPYHCFLSAASKEIWVGRTANDNEALTFQIARGSDLWLHISGKSGPHVIIPTTKGNAADRETLQDAFQLVLHFSGKLSSGEVTFTERKWVQKVRGKKGAVTLQQMKNEFIRKDEQRLERILGSKDYSSSLKR